MKSIAIVLLVASTFGTSYADGTPGWGNNVWTFDRLAARDASSANQSAVPMNRELRLPQQSETTTVFEEAPSNTPRVGSANSGPTLQDSAMSALEYGAIVAGLSLTYFYGPALLFWGTYHMSCYILPQVGITGFTGMCAATNAGMLLSNSAVAKCGLVMAGAFVGKYGAQTACKTTKTVASGAWTLGGYALSGANSLGKAASSWFWGKPQEESQTVTSIAPTPESVRAARIAAFERRAAPVRAY